MTYTKRSLRGEQRALREKMRGLGLSRRQVAVEFARRYGLRPRAAWRHANGWSLVEAAERISGFAARSGVDPSGATVAMTCPHLSEYENWPGPGVKPAGRRPTPYLLSLLASVYECAVGDLLDLADYQHMPPTDQIIINKAAPPDDKQDHELPARPLTRRQSQRGSALQPAADTRAKGLAPTPGVSIFGLVTGLEELTNTSRLCDLGAVFGRSSNDGPLDTEPLVSVLAGQAPPGRQDPPPNLAVLAAMVNRARRQYQSCRYSELIRDLPHLLACLHAASVALDGEDKSRAFTLSADAYHVAAGLVLKLDDQGLASLAADRSMRAAEASGDPVTIAASARIWTHALMSGSHLAAAISAAKGHAARLDREVSCHTPESLSVYGSLLLRGAIAAAQHDQRATALELLTEADSAAQRLGVDGNLRWTAFGPTNANLHRVNIAVTLGDAGAAIDVARRIDLSTITVTERKAGLLIDATRAFLQWGRLDKAYLALRAAEETAHEEVAGRPSVRRLVGDLMTSAPPSLRRDVARFAAQVGVISV